MRSINLVSLNQRNLVFYRRIIIATVILSPFLNRYNPSPLSILISCLLGFVVGILVCLFHYELFNKDRNKVILFHSPNTLIFSLVALTIIVDAIGRALIIGLLKIGWIPHLVLMIFVYLFLGAVIFVESARINLSPFLIVIKLVFLLIGIRAIFVIVFTISKLLVSPLTYNLVILGISSAIEFLMLLPGIFIGYKKKNLFTV